MKFMTAIKALEPPPKKGDEPSVKTAMTMLSSCGLYVKGVDLSAGFEMGHYNEVRVELRLQPNNLATLTDLMNFLNG